MVAINLRGTSGAGKSHLVRRVMELYPGKSPVFRGSRKRPHRYLLRRENDRSLVVVGHYETPCGGCDTIKTVDEVYLMVNDAVGEGHDVLYEGIMVMDDVKRAVVLAGTTELTVVGLTTPVTDCIEAIKDRRKARKDERELDPKNTVARAERCARGLARLREAGVKVAELDREEAFVKVCELLCISSMR